MDAKAPDSTNRVTLRFRVDRTVKTGMPVIERVCNLDCIWCHHDYMDHSAGQRKAISNSEFVEIIQRVIEVANPDDVLVRISGDGEPTLTGEEELVDLIHQLRTLSHLSSVKLTTNGILLEEMIPNLKNAGLDGVNISLNTLDPHIYYLYAGVDGISKVKNSIITALENELNTKVNILFTRLNAREIDDFIALVEQHPRLSLKFFDLIPNDLLSKRFFIPLSVLENKLSSIAEQIFDFENGYSGKEYKISNGGSIYLKTSWINNCPNMDCHVRNSCQEGCRSSIRIRADGILQPCGIREDNILDLFSPEVTTQDIHKSLRSGGKI